MATIEMCTFLVYFLFPVPHRAFIAAVGRAALGGRPAELGPIGLAVAAAPDAAPTGAAAGAGGAPAA